MWIIGVDYHPSVQQIAFVNTDTGECGERRLSHSDREAEKFYRELKAAGCSVRVGMEASGHARWFERLLAELGFELWIGDPVQIKAKRVRKQKTGGQTAWMPRCCCSCCWRIAFQLPSARDRTSPPLHCYDSVAVHRIPRCRYLRTRFAE